MGSTIKSFSPSSFSDLLVLTTLPITLVGYLHKASYTRRICSPLAAERSAAAGVIIARWVAQ